MIKDIFPTRISIIDNFISNDQASDIINILDRVQFSKHGSLDDKDLSTYHTVQDILSLISTNVQSASDIITKLQAAVDDYCQHTSIVKSQISNSWINVSQSGSILKPHNHSGCQVSGALYLQTDDSSSSLVFTNPNPYLIFNEYDKNNLNQNAFTHINVQALKTRLILFPSWLIHQTIQQNQSNRIVLSFNCN